ncbi:hypothetical protein TNCV_977501 [Trichonephila clavipes]|nr:hypothetical protein TNCV_977501 [Trichonephila clavipes]
MQTKPGLVGKHFRHHCCGVHNACSLLQIDLVANFSSSLPSYMSPTAPDNALPLSEDPDGIFHPAVH